MIAIPSEPPTWRMLFRTAEPTPALSTSTDPIAAAVVGVIVSAIPTPPTISPGKRFHHVLSRPRREKIRSEPATSSIPIPTSQREPILSE